MPQKLLILCTLFCCKTLAQQQNQSRTNITIGLVSWYCLYPNLTLDGSFVTSHLLGGYTPAQLEADGYDAWGYILDSTLEVAVADVNSDPTILPGVHINLKRFSDCGEWKPDTFSTWTGFTGGFAGSIMALDIVERHKDVIGVVGLERSRTAKSIAETLSAAQIPYCSGSQVGPHFSNKYNYPYYWRTISNSGLGEHVYRLLAFWNVTQVAYIYQRNQADAREEFRSISGSLTARGIAILANIGIASYDDEISVEYISDSLVSTNARYIIISGDNYFSAGVLHTMSESGLVDGTRVFMGTNAPVPYGYPYDVYGDSYFQYIQAFIQLTPAENTTPRFHTVKTEVNKRIGFNLSTFDLLVNNVPQFYDCLLNMMHGFKKVLQTNATLTNKLLASRQLNKFMNYTAFQDTGYEGVLESPLQFTNGDLLQGYQAWSFTGDYYNMTAFGQTNPKGTNFHYYTNATPIFFGGSSVIPSDGRDPELVLMYSLNTFEGHVLLIFSTIIVVTSIFSAIFVFRFRFSALGRAASFQETLSLTFGCTLAGLSLLFLIPDFALNYSCKLQVVVLVSSYALITTPLICKNLKAFQILHRMSRQRGEKLNNTTRMFRLLNIALLTLEAAGLVVWWLKTNLKRVLIHTTALDYYFCRVQASPFAPTFFLFGLNIFFMIALLLAAALSTSIKLSLYNETATLMVTGATLTLVSGLIFAMSKTPEPTTAFNIGVLVFIAAILIIFQNVGIRAMQMFYERVGHSNGRSAVSRVASKMTSLATHGRVGSSRSLKRSHSRVVLSQTSSRRYDMYAAKRVDEEGVVFRDATAWGAVWRTGCMIIHCLGGRKCWVSLEGEQVTLCELLRRDDQVSRDGVCVLIKRFSKLRKGVKFAAVVELASEGEAEHLVDAILKARSELMVPHHEFASMHPPIPFHAQ